MAQQTSDKERTGWYASNPQSLAVVVILILVLIVVGALLVMR